MFLAEIKCRMRDAAVLAFRAFLKMVKFYNLSLSWDAWKLFPLFFFVTIFLGPILQMARGGGGGDDGGGIISSL